VLAELKANKTLGTGPVTLHEKRDIRVQAEMEAAEREQEEKARNITFGEIFTDHYYPQAEKDRKNLHVAKREESLYRLWIAPVLGKMPIRDIQPINLQKIKKNLAKAERAPRTIQYALAIVRQVFKFAIVHNLFSGKNPADTTGGVKRPDFDNRRTRLLSREEAAELLTELSMRSTDVHDMTMFSLYTGARAGEIFSLKWSDIDLKKGVVLLKGTKSGKNRPLFLTDDLKSMLAHRRMKTAPGAVLVFPKRENKSLSTDTPADEKKIVQISDTFNRVVDELKLNEGITDRLEKVTFHTLRHTFASWLAMDGINPFHLKELLGHSDLKLTERYSHLSESALKQAAMRIQNI
jgi:integrase